MVSEVNPGMVVYRLAAPGHADCEKHTQPFEDESQFVLQDPPGKSYKWDMVPQFNSYVSSKFQELQKPNWMLLDIYQMTILRPDGHVGTPYWNLELHDCLHYKSPGVPDWWN